MSKPACSADTVKATGVAVIWNGAENIRVEASLVAVKVFAVNAPGTLTPLLLRASVIAAGMAVPAAGVTAAEKTA